MYSFAIITLFFSSESCPSCSQLSSKPKLSAPSHREGTYLHHAHFCVRALRACHFLAGSKRMRGLPCSVKWLYYLSINASLSSGAWSSAEIFEGNFFHKFFSVFLNASCPYQMEQHRSKRHKHNTNATVKLAVDREQTHALQTMEPDAPPIYFWVTIIKLRVSAFWMRVQGHIAIGNYHQNELPTTATYASLWNYKIALRRARYDSQKGTYARRSRISRRRVSCMSLHFNTLREQLSTKSEKWLESSARNTRRRRRDKLFTQSTMSWVGLGWKPSQV